MINTVSLIVYLQSKPVLTVHRLFCMLPAVMLLSCITSPVLADTQAGIMSSIEDAIDGVGDDKEVERARKQAEREAIQKANAEERARKQAERDAVRKAKQAEKAAERERIKAERAAAREEAKKKREAEKRAIRIEMAKKRAEEKARKEAAAQANAEAQKESCARLESLAKRIEVEYPRVVSQRTGHGSRDRNAPEAKIPFESWVMSDGLFGHVFGKQYEAMESDEQMQLQRSVADCQQPRTADGRVVMDNMLFFRAFDSRYKPRYEPGVQAIRKAREEYASLEQQLGELPPGKQSVERWREFVSEGERLKPYIGYSRQKTLQDLLRKGYNDVVLAAYREDSARIAANAQGLEGLQSFVRLRDTYRPAADSVGMGMSWTPAAQERLEELTSNVISEQRKRIDSLGDGMKGLENGVHWYRDYEKNMKNTGVSTLPELRDLKYYFAQEREKMLAGSMDVFRQKITAMQSTAELEEMEKQYLLPANDLQTTPGKQVYHQISLWNEELYKRSVLEPDGDLGNSIGPTGSQMYDAIYKRISAYTGINKKMYEQCGGVGSGSKPATNLACVYGTVMHFGDGDKPVRIATFKKYRCGEKESGFLCAYQMKLRGGSFDRLKEIMGVLEYDDGNAMALFVKKGDGWVYYAR